MAYCVKKIAVIFVFQKGDEYLFLKREHTGAADGFYMLPGGHVDEGETLLQACVLELKEELDITVQPADLEFKMVNPIKNHVNFFFLVKKYTGELKNNEPEKHSDLRFLSPTAEGIYPTVPEELKAIEQGYSFWER